MSKILLATLDYPPKRGGVARYLHGLVTSRPDDINVLYWQGNVPKRLRLLVELYRASKNHKEIWVSHIVPIGTAALLLSAVTKKPYVVFLHGMDFDLVRHHPLKRWLAFFVLKYARLIVCNSSALASEVHGFVGKEPVVLYPFVDDGLLKASELFEDRHDHFHSGPVHLITVGRLVERKGHEKVLRVLTQCPNLTYDIVGDGPERQGLEERVRDLGLAERVRFYPNVEDAGLPNLYAGADLFVMPTTKTNTDREGFGIVYLEASLFQIPVVATRQPGVDEAVVDGVSGILVEDTQEALVAAIDQLARDPGKRRDMGRAGRTLVLSHFTRASQMRKIASI